MCLDVLTMQYETKMNIVLIIMIMTIAIAIIATLSIYQDLNNNKYTEIGILKLRQIDNTTHLSSLRLNNRTLYIDNLYQWNIGKYINECCKITFISGCGQTNIIDIEILCKCKCE